jgi:hypothetical protein
MSLRATCLARIYSREGDAAKRIVAMVDSFEMIWVHAMANAAQMIKFESFWYRTEECLVGDSVRESAPTAMAHPRVALFVLVGEPQPTSV